MDKKIKILDTVKKRKIICRDTAEETKIGKTQAANLIKNQPQLRNTKEEAMNIKEGLKQVLNNFKASAGSLE